MREKSKLLLFVIVLLWGGCTSEKTQDIYNKSTFTSRLPAEPDMLNPILSSNGYGKQVANHIFSYLVHYDYQTLEISPMLAKALPEIKNITKGKHAGSQASTYEIHQEAVWDNGSPVTGNDVAFTIKTILNPKISAARLRAFLGKIKAVNIDPQNPKKFTIITEGNYFLIKEIFANFPIFPAYHYDSKGIMKNYTIEDLSNSKVLDKLEKEDAELQKFADQFHEPKYSREPNWVSGCGAYQLKEWISGQQFILQKKENWWGDKLSNRFPLLQALPEQIIFKIIPDATSAMTLLKDGSLDAMTAFPPKDFQAIQENEYAKERLNFYSPPAMIYYFIAINRNNPKLEDKKVRRALAHIMNVEEVIQLTQFGFAEKSIGPIFSKKSYFNSELKPLELDLDKAKNLLNDAGWKDSNGDGILDKKINGEIVELNLKYLINPGQTGQATGLLLKEKGKRVGVNFEIVTKEFVKKMQDVKSRNFELTLLATGFDYSLDDLRQVWHTTSDTPSGGNRTGFGSEDSDAIIEALEKTDDPDLQKEFYEKFQLLVYEDQPCIFLFSAQQNIAVNKRMKGIISPRRPGLFENLFTNK